jgi:hypothetical protein
MVKVQNFEVMSDKLNALGIYTVVEKVMHRMGH